MRSPPLILLLAVGCAPSPAIAPQKPVDSRPVSPPSVEVLPIPTPPHASAASNPTAKRTARHAILVEYEAGEVAQRVISGADVDSVLRWLSALEGKQPLAGPPASGKPLAWLHLVDDTNSTPWRATRSIGIHTDTLRALNRPLSTEELESLRSLFRSGGTDFRGQVQPARP